MRKKTGKREKPMIKAKKKVAKAKPAKKQEIVEEKPTKRVDIDTELYRDLFKFLEEKVSVECFIDLHDHCYGKADCECTCHTNK
ncbi:MAG: hypothetical protein ACE5KA_02245 [Nitrososphaerales archaeon]